MKKLIVLFLIILCFSCEKHSACRTCKVYEKKTMNEIYQSAVRDSLICSSVKEGQTIMLDCMSEEHFHTMRIVCIK